MKFGQYELLEQIAVGGMAEVFKGRVVGAEGFEKFVAIKRILPDLAEDERFVKMLLTEARIHSALSHRNIVQIHDLGISEQGEYFIVLEYVEGYDLRIITDQLHGAGEIIPEALSLHIAAEIAQGLHFAHEQRGADGQRLGLIHRDVTPSNILISFAGEVKLSDFGLAKRRHDRSVVGSLKGNLAYMSPEQAMQSELDRRTDIFSLGAVLFELLTGRRLREITDEVAGFSQVASGVVPSARGVRPDLPAPLETLLDSALAADPAKRFRDAASFGAAIRDALGQLNIAVGASDLSALLSVITPPRRARTLNLERSKVIRIGPDAQALKEALAAPATPGPVAVPVAAPRPPSRPNATQARFADPGPTPQITPPPPGNDGIATPMPSTPLPPARTRGYTPRPPTDQQQTPPPPARERGKTPPPPTRERGKTPPPPTRERSRTPPPPARERGMTPMAPGRARGRTPRPPADQQPTAPFPPARSGGYTQPPPAAEEQATPLPPARERMQTPPPPTGQRATPRSPSAAQTQLGRSVPPQGGQRLPPSQRDQRPQRNTWPPGGQPPGAPAPQGQQAPRPATARARTSGQRPIVPPETPAYGVERPPPAAFRRPSQPAFPAQQPPHDLAFNTARVHHETARVQLRQPSRWPTILLLLVLLLGGGAAGVHFFLIPLDVVVTWRGPAGLSISTQPTGAALRVDGVPIAGSAPTTVTVWRDRREHVIEASLPGYETTRDTVRYDKSVALSVQMYLPKDKAAPPPPPPAPAPVPEGGPAPPP